MKSFYRTITEDMLDEFWFRGVDTYILIEEICKYPTILPTIQNHCRGVLIDYGNLYDGYVRIILEEYPKWIEEISSYLINENFFLAKRKDEKWYELFIKMGYIEKPTLFIEDFYIQENERRQSLIREIEKKLDDHFFLSKLYEKISMYVRTLASDYYWFPNVANNTAIKDYMSENEFDPMINYQHLVEVRFLSNSLSQIIKKEKNWTISKLTTFAKMRIFLGSYYYDEHSTKGKGALKEILDFCNIDESKSETVRKCISDTENGTGKNNVFSGNGIQATKDLLAKYRIKKYSSLFEKALKGRI